MEFHHEVMSRHLTLFQAAGDIPDIRRHIQYAAMAVAVSLIRRCGHGFTPRLNGARINRVGVRHVKIEHPGQPHDRNEEPDSPCHGSFLGLSRSVSATADVKLFASPGSNARGATPTPSQAQTYKLLHRSGTWLPFARAISA